MQLFPQPVLSCGSGNMPPPSHPLESQWHIHTDTLHQTGLEHKPSIYVFSPIQGRIFQIDPGWSGAFMQS